MSIRRDEVNLVVTINGTNAGKSINDLKNSSRDLQRQLSKLEIGSDDFKKVKLELDGINKELATATGRAKQVDRAMAGVGSTTGLLPGIFSKISTALSTLGIIGLVNMVVTAGQKLFGLGKEMEVLTKKAETVFGVALPQVTAAAEKNANAMGLTAREYTNAAAAAGDLLIPMGFAREEAAAMSTGLVNLSGALSEWTGGQRSAEDVSKILTKAMLGEREELKSLGISISEADVKTRLQSKGLEKLTGNMLQQAKAAATLELITEKSVDAQTAYANNSDTLVRKQAEMSAKLSDITEKISTALIPVFHRLLLAVEPVVDGIGDAADAMTKGTEATTAWGKVLKFLADVIGTVVGWQLGMHKAVASFTLFVAEKTLPVIQFFTSAFYEVYNAGVKVANFLNEFAGTNLRFQPVDIDGFNKKMDRTVELLKRAREEANKPAPPEKKATLGGSAPGGGATGGGDGAAAVKVTFEQRLKALDEGAKQEALLLENQRIKREVDEQTADERLYNLEKQHLERRLLLFQQYGKGRTSAALDTANQLAVIQQYEADRAAAAAAGELERLQTLGVSKLDLVNFQAESEKNAKAAVLEYTQKLADAEVEHYRDKTAAQVAAQEQLQQRMVEVSTQMWSDLGTLTGDFLGEQKKDTKAYLKDILKLLLTAFQKQAIIAVSAATTSEISKPFPANLFTTGIKIAAINVAAGAAKAAINGFAGGGYTGPGMGAPDSSGHRPAGIVHEGEYVVPKWMVNNPAHQGTISMLERARRIGYAEGGLVNTTPVAAPVFTGSQDAKALEEARLMRAEFRILRENINTWQRGLNVKVAYTDIEEVGNTLNSLRADASL